MNAIVEPIHIEAIGLANVRFFKSPLDGPRQPWHAIDDIYAAMALPRGLRRALKRNLLKHPEYCKAVQTIRTTSGTTEIGPNWMAQGLIGMAVECAGLSSEFEDRYVDGMFKANEALVAHMPEALDRMNYTIAAFRNENDLPPMAPLTEASIVRKPREGGS